MTRLSSRITAARLNGNHAAETKAHGTYLGIVIDIHIDRLICDWINKYFEAKRPE